MAELKVDIIRHDYNEAKGKLIVWLFNDPNFYSAKEWKLTAKYDFGRKPNDEDGNPTDKKQKLLVGLYREPFRDGWKYTINEKVHPEMVDTVLNYIFFGFQKKEDGEMEPFTYLRHNRKALGISCLNYKHKKASRAKAQEAIVIYPGTPASLRAGFLLPILRETYIGTLQNRHFYSLSICM